MSCLIPHGKVRLTLVLRLLLFSLLSCHSSRTLPQPKKKKRKRVRKLQPPLPHRATRKCYRHISIFRLSDRQYHSCKSSPSLHYSPVIFYLCQVHKRHPKPKKGVFLSVTTMISVQMVNDTQTQLLQGLHIQLSDKAPLSSASPQI